MGWPRRKPKKNLKPCPGLVDHYIYYASSDAESTPEAITKRVKEWRAANSKPGFKTV
ncbi:bacteriocin immunity protein [Pseudomonas gingeri]|uniref:Bacteriocin immunity protein n=1 Tax=Pseudomonas gingeri TaxID=117681 RepID=A0A7Y7WAL0_9PSED|nr:bacteriocin immunity protein [Pseudomonas gingeri]